METQVLSRKEVVAMTGIGMNTILKLTQSGELPCFRTSYPRGKTLYYRKDVMEFIERQKKKQEQQSNNVA